MSAPPDEDLPFFAESLSPPASTPPTGETPAVFDSNSIEQLFGIRDPGQDLVRERYERFLVALHVEVVGAAAYTARHGEAAGRSVVQRTRELCAPLVQDHKGRLVKTVGEGLLAAFPTVDAGVNAAIGMQRALLAENLRTQGPEQHVIEVRIGVHCGAALVNDEDGDIYGDTVNLASRIQAKAGARQILISEHARANLGAPLSMQPAGTVSLKEQDVAIFALDWDVPVTPLVDPDAPPELESRYAVLERLGVGTHATVWRARDEQSGEDVAVKVLHRQPMRSVAVRERLEQDVLLAERFEHPNAVRVRDFAIPQGGEAYVVMDLMRGETLRRRLEQTPSLPPHVAALLAHEIATGLAAAHEAGLVHRDLKPENIHLTEDGVVQLTDYGLAADAGDLRAIAPGVSVGSPAYLSPEQVKGEGATPASDVFALGIVLYEALTGQLPFSASSTSGVMYRVVAGRYEDPETIVPGLDHGFAQVLRRCLEVDPAKRFQDGAAVREALHRALHKRGVVDPARALAAWLISGDESSLETLLPPPPARPLVPRRIGFGWMVAACAAVGVAVFLVTRLLGPDTPEDGAPDPALARAGLDPAPLPAAAPSEAQAADPSAPDAPIRPVLMPSAQATPPEEDAPTEAPGMELRDDAPDGAGGARDLETARVEGRPPESAEGAEEPLEEDISDEEALAALDAATASAASSTEPRSSRTRRSRKAPAVAKMGTLSLSVSGWADVMVDGKSMGRFPQVRRFQLTEGVHVVELYNPHRQPYRAKVQVQAGQEVAHRAELVPIP